MRYSLPLNASSEQWHVCGYAGGLFGQRVPATATQDKFALTQDMRGIEGERLFHFENVGVARSLPLSLQGNERLAFRLPRRQCRRTSLGQFNTGWLHCLGDSS